MMVNVLECLGDGKEHYPYDIVVRSNGDIKLGSIYVLLCRLIALELVSSRKEKPSEQDKRRIPRNYFQLTKLGVETLAAHRAAQEAFNNAMTKIKNEH